MPHNRLEEIARKELGLRKEIRKKYIKKILKQDLITLALLLPSNLLISVFSPGVGIAMGLMILNTIFISVFFIQPKVVALYKQMETEHTEALNQLIKEELEILNAMEQGKINRDSNEQQ